jgi:hypothetical protein
MMLTPVEAVGDVNVFVPLMQRGFAARQRVRVDGIDRFGGGLGHDVC